MYRTVHNKNSKKICINVLFRNLTQKLQLLKKTEEAARQLESTKIHNQGG